MKTRLMFTAIIALASAASATHAIAACGSSSCTIGGTEYCCDQIYTGTGTKNLTYSTMAGCDNVGTAATPGTLDGKCVVCLTNSGGATLNGGSIGEYICGSSGNDTIDGRGGDDTILGFDGDDVISGGNGADNIDPGNGTDVVYGGDGNDAIADISGPSYIDGGDGNDTIVSVDGDDQLFGGNGDDLIANYSGADWVDGGAGNDTLVTLLFGGSLPSQLIGATYCGGTGNDTIAVDGGGHTCIDAGDDTDSCTYAFNVADRSATSLDIATAIGCETTTGTYSTRTPTCGCP
jgi:Ca2+-binding RTX toxin-like protein